MMEEIPQTEEDMDFGVVEIKEGIVKGYWEELAKQEVRQLVRRGNMIPTIYGVGGQRGGVEG